MPYSAAVAGGDVGYRRSAERLKNDFDLDLPIAEWLDKEPELHEEIATGACSAQSR